MLLLHAFARVGIAAAATIAVVAVPSVAAAHVTLNPNTAEPGGYGTFDVRVPNEMDDANTVEVQVFLPTEHPIASVSTQPVPGWTISVKRQKLDQPITSHGSSIDEVVSQVTWSGGQIKPGEFQQFPLSLGPLPEDVDTLYFKSLQTYSNGEVVRWIELPSGAQEPERPAPAVQLSAADTEPVAQSEPQPDADDDGSGTALGTAALAVSVCGLAVAGWAVRRSSS